ncbi:hypothetical protein EVAR_7618_1 [Eumeta japonica]|uniref:Uncharacterized protein n=1 Tax=Eumeta variegata TaxID=151549 RepID=A0A4C1TJC1_EUMVA|nr:hypothetical protein EVAR_7618_1 [Eumeta japonica]
MTGREPGRPIRYCRKSVYRGMGCFYVKYVKCMATPPRCNVCSSYVQADALSINCNEFEASIMVVVRRGNITVPTNDWFCFAGSRTAPENHWIWDKSGAALQKKANVDYVLIVSFVDIRPKIAFRKHVASSVWATMALQCALATKRQTDSPSVYFVKLLATRLTTYVARNHLKGKSPFLKITITKSPVPAQTAPRRAPSRAFPICHMRIIRGGSILKIHIKDPPPKRIPIRSDRHVHRGPENPAVDDLNHRHRCAPAATREAHAEKKKSAYQRYSSFLSTPQEIRSPRRF